MEAANPWWVAEQDHKYIEWNRLKVKWQPGEMRELGLTPFSFNFISGPRQVGKTTLVTLVIHSLLAKGIDPNSIFYFSCDEVTDYKELGEILDSYQSYKKSRGAKRSFIFLDEVTFVKDWWRPIKSRIDLGAFSSDVLTITGSASLDLLRQKESFPGRRGKGVDVKLRPLGFGSYVSALSKLGLTRSSSLTQIDAAMKANKIFEKRLGELFLDYLEAGGFPLAVQEKAVHDRVSEDTKRSLVDSVRRDWYGTGKSDKYMKEVISYILSARGAPISWLSISKATSIGSPNTARSYVETLQDLLLIVELDLIEPDGKVSYRKNKKIYFADPFVYGAFASYTRTAADEAAMVEATVASHISRTHEAFYWRNGTEVDLVTLEGKDQIGFEVKWGFKRGRKPRHIKKYFSLDRGTVPLFLATLSFA